MKIENWKACPVCSAHLVFYAAPDARVVCSMCNFTQFENPVPAAATLPINSRGQVLLVKRAFEPRAGYWAVVGGFLNVDESAEEGARRECKEEIGIDTRNTQLLYVGSYPSVYGNSGRRTLTITYYFPLPDTANIVLSEESSEYSWFDLDDLPEDIAFVDCELALRDLPRVLQATKKDALV